MNLKLGRALAFIMGSAILLTSYNNCAPGFKTGQSEGSNDLSSVSGSVGGLCEDSLMGLFERGYYPFLRTNCAVCHATDVDKPQFANPDVKWAFQSFMDKGYTKVSNNAINAGHQAGYTGPQHNQTINELRIEWQQGIKEFNQCKGATVISDTVDLASLLSLQTAGKALPNLGMGQSAVLSWNLNTELERMKGSDPLPNLPGAQFSIEVTRKQTAAGEQFYSFAAPTIYNSSVDIIVKSIYIKVNGRLMTFPTTYRYIDTAIRAGSKQDASGLISVGAATVPGATSSQDVIAVAFQTLAPTVLPPPKPPVVVNLAGPSVYIVNSSTGTLSVGVSFSEPSNDPATLTLEEDNGAMCGAGVNDFVTPSANCIPNVFSAMTSAGLNSAAHLKVGIARSIVYNSYNRFDWDFKRTVASLTLSQNDPQQVFQVELSQNIRREENRLLRLRLNVASDNIVAGTNNIIYVLIRKADNPALAPGEISYSQLMGSKGILSTNCIACHNSKDLQGGYDVTNYELMVSNRVLVPGNATASKMYRRMVANDPEFGNLDPMPRTGFMIQEKVDAVKSWIQSGAKNN